MLLQSTFSLQLTLWKKICSLVKNILRNILGKVLGLVFYFIGMMIWLSPTSLGTNSLMFMNCSVFCDVQYVWSSVLCTNMMFRSVRSSVLLLYDQTSRGTYSLMFMNCSVFCNVRHVQSSFLGQNVMFRKFDVRTFNVRSVRSSVFWCSFQD